MTDKITARLWLIDLRKSKSLTQYQVAEGADITRSYYTMIEQGTRAPSPKVAQCISKILGFDWTIFFAHEGNYSTQLSDDKVTINY